MAKFYSIHLFSPDLLMNTDYELIYFEITCVYSLILDSTETELLEEQAIKM